MADVSLAFDILARDKASKTFDDVAGSVGRAAKIGSFLGSAAGNLASSGLGAMKTFAQGSVDAFAAVEDATGAAGVQFGSALPDVVSFAEKASKSFGLSKRAALDAQNTFGTLGKAAGLTDKPLAAFSQKLTGLAGDLASFKGTSTEQAIDAVGAALRGESEPLRAYGVLINDAAIQAEGLAMGLAKPVVNADKLAAANLRVTIATQSLKKAIHEHGAGSLEAQKAQGALTAATNAQKDAAEGSIKPLTATNKTLAIQSLILKQTKDAQGDYSRTSSSTANVQKTLAAETENAQAALGQRLAPAITLVRQGLLLGIQSLTGFGAGVAAVTGFVSENSTAFEVIAGVITVVLLPTLVSAAIGYATTATAATVSAAKQAAAWLAVQVRSIASVAVLAVSYALTVAGWVSAGISAVANAALVVGGWVLMGVQSTLQAARMAAAWLVAMGPIGWAIAAVVGISALVITHWDTIKAATAAAWSWVSDKVSGVVHFLTGLFLNFTGPGLIIKHFDAIVGFVRALPGRIAGVAGGMFDGISDAFRASINVIIRGWNGLEFRVPQVDTHIPGVGKIGGFTLGLPNIPQLAEGGIIRARPGGILANLGEGRFDEAVVPLDGRALRGSRGGDVNVALTVQGSVTSERDLVQSLVEGLDRYVRNGGTLGSLVTR